MCTHVCRCARGVSMCHTETKGHCQVSSGWLSTLQLKSRLGSINSVKLPGQRHPPVSLPHPHPTSAVLLSWAPAKAQWDHPIPVFRGWMWKGADTVSLPGNNELFYLFFSNCSGFISFSDPMVWDTTVLKEMVRFGIFPLWDMFSVCDTYFQKRETLCIPTVSIGTFSVSPVSI